MQMCVYVSHSAKQRRILSVITFCRPSTFLTWLLSCSTSLPSLDYIHVSHSAQQRRILSVITFCRPSTYLTWLLSCSTSLPTLDYIHVSHSAQQRQILSVMTFCCRGTFITWLLSFCTSIPTLDYSSCCVSSSHCRPLTLPPLYFLLFQLFRGPPPAQRPYLPCISFYSSSSKCLPSAE